jgi:hypothetical protein
MILGIRKVHLHVQVIIDLVHHAAVFSIAACLSDPKSGIVVALWDLVESLMTFFVQLGVHWCQTSELDSPINCG